MEISPSNGVLKQDSTCMPNLNLFTHLTTDSDEKLENATVSLWGSCAELLQMMFLIEHDYLVVTGLGSSQPRAFFNIEDSYVPKIKSEGRNILRHWFNAATETVGVGYFDSQLILVRTGDGSTLEVLFINVNSSQGINDGSFSFGGAEYISDASSNVFLFEDTLYWLSVGGSPTYGFVNWYNLVMSFLFGLTQSSLVLRVTQAFPSWTAPLNGAMLTLSVEM